MKNGNPTKKREDNKCVLTFDFLLFIVEEWTGNLMLRVDDAGPGVLPPAYQVIRRADV
jgi:hypothetical protein